VALEHEILDGAHDFIALNILVVLKSSSCVKNFVGGFMKWDCSFVGTSMNGVHLENRG
jgi:hypothetical protein